MSALTERKSVSLPNFRGPCGHPVDGGRGSSADFFAGAPCGSSRVALTFYCVSRYARLDHFGSSQNGHHTQDEEQDLRTCPRAEEQKSATVPNTRSSPVTMRFPPPLDGLFLELEAHRFPGRMSLRLIQRPDATSDAASGRASDLSPAFRRSALSTRRLR